MWCVSVDMIVIVIIQTHTFCSPLQISFTTNTFSTFVNTIHAQITPQKDGIRYLHVKEKPGHYSIGIFVFPPNAIIPLHNHPGMIVLSRLLYGSLKAKTYDIIFHDDNQRTNIVENDDHHQDGDGGDHHQEDTTSWLRVPNFVSRVLPQSLRSSSSSSSMKGIVVEEEEIPKGFIHVYENNTKELRSPEITELCPEKSNVHEFQAGPNGAAVLDVLVPPYDCENERDCTFYRENRHYEVPAMVEDNENDNANDMDCDCDKMRRRVWLEPIEQPDWFHCTCGHYAGLKNGCNNNEDE